MTHASPSPFGRFSGGVRLTRPALMLATVLGFLAGHLAVLTASLEDLDSINFALGLRHFDVALHQPHPPGYPLFIGLGRLALALGVSEARALAGLGVVCGGAALWAMWSLFKRIGHAEAHTSQSVIAVIVAATSPLYWFTAGRPLSDTTGLAAALCAQAAILAAGRPGAFVAAAALAGLAAGARSQVVWLTVPLLAWQWWRWKSATKGTLFAQTVLAWTAGVLVWAVPLVMLNGGIGPYWHALADQGAEDLSGILMLWTKPTPGELGLALYYAFVAPWATWWIALIALPFAAVGVWRCAREGWDDLILLGVAFGPYALFDIVFQETFTTRYALPLVVPTAWLVVHGARANNWTGRVLPWIVMTLSLSIAAPALASYAVDGAPAFRMLADMRGEQDFDRQSPPPVLALHRREALDLRKAFTWMGDAAPKWSRQLPSPPQREWQQVVDYWLQGGRDRVWWVADPGLTGFVAGDLSLVDPRSWSDRREYRWPFDEHLLLGGVRPDIMDWYVMPPPGWILQPGWALTPDTAGVADARGLGPGRGRPLEGWVRRRTSALTLLYGGRNFESVPASVSVAIDGRTVDTASVEPGFFLRLVEVPAAALNGDGTFAKLTAAATHPKVALEQFDAQSSNEVVSGFAGGWNELEHRPDTGALWRWTTEASTLRVHTAGRSLVLLLRGESPLKYFPKPSRLLVRAGTTILFDEKMSDDFSLVIPVDAEQLGPGEATITIETDQVFSPADRSRRSQDHRRLGLRLYECVVRPSS